MIFKYWRYPSFLFLGGKKKKCKGLKYNSLVFYILLCIVFEPQNRESGMRPKTGLKTCCFEMWHSKGALKCPVTFHCGIYCRKLNRMSDCTLPSLAVLQMPNDIAGQRIPSICFPKVRVLKLFFTLLSTMRTCKPRSLPPRSLHAITGEGYIDN